MMKRYKAVLGTLLTIATLIGASGVVQAAWYHADSVYSYYKVRLPDNAVGPPDGDHATIQGSSGDPGELILDMGDNPIPDKRSGGVDFWVNASSNVTEYYVVWVITADWATVNWACSGNDTVDYPCHIPANTGTEYKYLNITAISWTTGPGDPHAGPDIDAVSWED